MALLDEGLIYNKQWVRGDPSALGFHKKALEGLVREAEATRTDSLLVMKDGQIVVERYFGHPQGPIELRSVTKSIVGLAVAFLLAEGKIPSLDTPLSHWFPEWKEGDKAAVTVRHLLNHTSGLKHDKYSGNLEKQKDQVAYVHAQPIVETPGKSFSYSNEATLLLSGVIHAAAGKPVDIYLNEKLFAPLEIKDWTWQRDGAGNALTYYGLALSARDLAKIGMFVMNEGEWNGQPLLPKTLVKQFTSPAAEHLSHYGFLWWIHCDSGGNPIGFYADGWLGQYLLIYPKQKLIAVRQLRAPSREEDIPNTYNQQYGFMNFRYIVMNALEQPH